MTVETSLASCHVRGRPADAVASAVAEVARGRLVVSDSRGDWVSVWGEDVNGARAGRLAERLSEDLDTVTAAFVATDAETIRYWVFDRAKLVDRHDSRRGPDGQALRVGQRQAFASACLPGITEDDVDDVLRASLATAAERVAALAELLGVDPERAISTWRELAASEPPTATDPKPSRDARGAHVADRPTPPGLDPLADAGTERPALHACAARGDVAAARQLLSEGHDPNQPDADGLLPLHHALLSARPDYGALSATERGEWWRRNAQSRAAAAERHEDPSQAFERERRLETDQRAERTARLAEELLLAGALPDAPDGTGRTPLALAAALGLGETADHLLQAGANPDATNDDGETPLHAAADWGLTHPLSLLLAAGTSPDPTDRWGWTPLMAAARRGHAEAVQTLLASGADPHRETEDGRTALAIAREEGRERVVELLRGL